jgi:hypothetical protein
MEKKTSIYSNAKQCFLPENIIFDHLREEFNNVFEKFNDYNQPFSIKTTPNGVIEGLTKKDHNFFKESYVPAQPLRTIDEIRSKLLYDILDEELGVIEWQLIVFCTGFRDSYKGNRIILITGNVGEGKSSVINYVLKFLYYQKKSFKEFVLPIIFNCHGYKPELIKEVKDKGSLVEWIDKHINIFLNNINKDFSEINNEEFWIWYEERFKTFYSAYVKDLKKLGLEEKELDNRIKERRMNEKYDNKEFIYNAAYYITDKQKKNIVVVFDNIDPFDIEIIELFYWKAESIINISPIKVIISLRGDTYRKLKQRIIDIGQLKTIQIYSDLKKIIERRCLNLEKKIELNSEKKPLIIPLHKSGTIEVKSNPYKVIHQIITIILNPIGMNCISTFSCKNIRNSLELLRIVFSSGFLPICEIGGMLMISEKETQQTLPPEYLISTITTFGYGTFFSKELKKTNVPGIINILSCSHHQHPIQIFSKLYILSYLKNKGFELDTNNKDKILEIYQACTHSMIIKEELNESFFQSFYRLFTTGLISSPEIHNVYSIDEFENDVTEVRLSSLGDYYFDFLLTYPFYLIFAKDDVYVENPSSFSDAYFIYNNTDINKYFWTNFRNLSLFLKEYGLMEIFAIKEFIKHETYTIFQHNFGCLSDNLFTVKIIKGLQNFVVNKDLKSVPLINFLNEKQIFNTADITILDDTRIHLESEYRKLFI